jgi:hypothetical protein
MREMQREKERGKERQKWRDTETKRERERERERERGSHVIQCEAVCGLLDPVLGCWMSLYRPCVYNVPVINEPASLR